MRTLREWLALPPLDKSLLLSRDVPIATRREGLVLLLLASLALPAFGTTIRMAPSRALLTGIAVRPKATPPKTGPSQMDKPGPVSSPDPYFTLKLGEAEIYRDARDPTLAYYRPIFRLGNRTGTPLAEGVGALAAELDGFRFRYYKFESGGQPKWADVQVVIVAERPADATLESVQERWKDITRLVPLPFKFDTSTGVRMILPYPPRVVTFSQLEAFGGTEDLQWYCFSTNTHPTPPDLLTSADNNTLNEAKARDFAALITSDLSDMTSFQPTLEVRATHPGWQGATPFLRFHALPMAALRMTPPPPAGPTTPQPSSPIRRGVLRMPLQLADEPIPPNAAMQLAPALRTAPARVAPAPPGNIQHPSAVLRTPVLARPDLIRVIGTLQPRQDIDYTYSDSQEMIARLPISYPKATTPNYDYYFLSDSGRFGGPHFEPSSLPDRPQPADPPAGFSGYWYESHFLGKRLVWPAPKQLRLSWDLASGLRPSCRFSLTTGEGGKLIAHISYDLYPDFSMRQLSAAVAALVQQTGEKIDLLPFTDVLDANQISLASSSPTVHQMLADKRISVTKLTPRAIDEAWFRISADLPIDDWATFTLFMKLGELGAWDFGILTGATSGASGASAMGEKVTFQLIGDLLQTMGGPVVAASKSYDPATGGYEVTVDNYGLQPLQIKGLRFLVGQELAPAPASGASAIADLWLDGAEVNLPGVGSASSFDQSDGAGGSVTATIAAPASPQLKAALGTEQSPNLAVALPRDMIGPSTAPEAAGGVDPDILFSFLRSLCYQYIGSSEIIEVPVAPAELSQWLDYQSGRIVLRFQGFVYTKDLDLSGTNKMAIRRLPREGAYASAGKPGEADLLEYRAIFVRKDGTVVYLPPAGGASAQPEGESRWLTGDITGVNLDMTKAGASPPSEGAP